MRKLENPPDYFEYADGSGNLFKVKDNLLIYEPVEAKNSSSGLYSGGQYSELALIDSEYESLLKTALALAQSSESHEIKRMKGTGLLRLFWGKQSLVVILKFHEKIKDEFENMLKSKL